MRSPRFAREVLAAAYAVSQILIGGCKGESPLQPPVIVPKDTTALNLVVPAAVTQTYATYPMVAISFSATATSTKRGSIPSSAISYTVNGQPASSPVKVQLGSATVCAITSDGNGGQVSVCQTVPALPSVISGKVLSPTSTGEYIPQKMYVIAGPDGGPKDSALVGADGSYSLNTRYVGMGNVPIIVRGDPSTYPSLIRTGPEFFATPVTIQVPRSFASPSCSSAGTGKTFPFNLVDSYTPGPDGVAFYKRNYFDPANGDGTVKYGFWTYNVGSWKTLPVKVAFARDSSNAPILAGDSIAFWTHADSLNRAFCTSVFTPANEADVKAGGGILVRVDTRLSTDYAGVDMLTDYKFGFIGFQRASDMANQIIAQHELLHTLGIGHEHGRSSVMSSTSTDRTALNQEDVAKILLLRRMRDLERKYVTRFSSAYSHLAAVVLENGGAEFAVAYTKENGTFGSIPNPAGPMIPIVP